MSQTGQAVIERKGDKKMASISSTNSTSSLGNTSLRGFGGMASGIDRDSIIEQMTLGTTTKINNQKRKMTQLQWKQEAYRGVSDKIFDLTDKYASYSSSSNLKDAMAFSRNKVTVHGKDESTRFVTATGSSQLVNNISITAVEQLATSTVLQSKEHINAEGLETTIKDLESTVNVSNIKGGKLTFGTWNYTDKRFTNTKTFTFANSYKDDNNITHTINYTPETEEEYEQLEKDLNALLKDSGIEFGDGNKISDAIQFKYDKGTGTLGIEVLDESKVGNFVITNSADSRLMGALGYKEESDDSTNADDSTNTDDSTEKHGITFTDFTDNIKASGKTFDDTAISRPSTLEYLTSQKVTFDYDGNKKEIELITADDRKELDDKIAQFKATNGNNTLTDAQKEELLTDVKNNLQNRLDRAFGNHQVNPSTGETTNGVTVEISSNGGLTFKTKLDSKVSMTANDSELLKNIGLEYGSSNKVNLDGKLNQGSLAASLKKDSNGNIDFTQYTTDGKQDSPLDLEINGVKINGLTRTSSVNDILSKINSTTEAGVRATYVEATGKFTLVSSETGANRDITLDSNLAQDLFGDGTGGRDIKYGENAKIHVSYGDGINVELERSSNTFNLDGLNVTISGKFGFDANGNLDSSQAVTFTAKADVDAAVEKVKGFFEDFNALVTEINTQITTRPDSNYQPLTDEQKAQMDETSIENWENKAKQGMLYGDSVMRDLSMDVQAIFTKMMEAGASYNDLQEIGITYSEDYLDGGTLVFDESKFREAMESDPEKVSNIFTGGGGVSKGLINIVEDTFTPYATRYASKNGNSYGRLVEVAGSEKKPTTLMNNQIYKQLEDMQEIIDRLQEQLSTEQDRYISQFTTMESLLNKMNSQSSYLSQLTA